jgi:hypothetical protein
MCGCVGASTVQQRVHPQPQLAFFLCCVARVGEEESSNRFLRCQPASAAVILEMN